MLCGCNGEDGGGGERWGRGGGRNFAQKYKINQEVNSYCLTETTYFIAILPEHFVFA